MAVVDGPEAAQFDAQNILNEILLSFYRATQLSLAEKKGKEKMLVELCYFFVCPGWSQLMTLSPYDFLRVTGVCHNSR